MKRLLTLLLLAGFLVTFAPASSHAQHFSFGFSTGHHHHHHRHHGHWHGPCWGPPWWGPSLGFVFAPPPVVQERVIYVQPPPPVTSLTPANPPLSSIPAAPNNSQITIRNASGTRLPVTFLIDGQDIELADGETRTFAGQTQRTIRYDRGGRFGSTQQDLAPGNFEFRVTATGWDLVPKPELTASTRTATRANVLPKETVR